ncbi:hypothetical protein [Maritalea porphyrae]|uniref:hypothetical protein n=1 Tax=Maritalea porphyrae TaxID=880732 RepID=UPI0022AFFD21|nr:hypothetical protein [Maritalea porphyrae]MCZ4273319.1 hypothetical protein [Maritalea porphyrae]
MIGVLLKSVMGGGTKYLIAFALVSALGLFAYNKGDHDRSLICQATELTRQLELVKADRDRLAQQVKNAEQARKVVSEQLLADIKALTRAQTQAKEFADDVKSRDTVCPPVSADDAARLLKIQ